MALTKKHLPGEAVPYWNQNIPEERWTEECPPFLVGIVESDTVHLAIRNEDYQRMSWDEVRSVVERNRLELFNRVPIDLRRYRAYLAKIKQSHGSVMNYILKDRVRWDNLTAKGKAFQCPEDIRILYNDWPYGIDQAIVHLVVWTKFPFEDDPTTGDLTPESRKQIDDYVTATFRQDQKHERVLWFKNWAALKSVHSVEHFHVMLYGPDPEFTRRITSGDKPMAAQLSNEYLFDWSV